MIFPVRCLPRALLGRCGGFLMVGTLHRTASRTERARMAVLVPRHPLPAFLARCGRFLMVGMSRRTIRRSPQMRTAVIFPVRCLPRAFPRRCGGFLTAGTAHRTIRRSWPVGMAVIFPVRRLLRALPRRCGGFLMAGMSRRMIPGERAEAVPGLPRWVSLRCPEEGGAGVVSERPRSERRLRGRRRPLPTHREVPGRGRRAQREGLEVVPRSLRRVVRRRLEGEGVVVVRGRRLSPVGRRRTGPRSGLPRGPRRWPVRSACGC